METVLNSKTRQRLEKLKLSKKHQSALKGGDGGNTDSKNDKTEDE